MRHFLPQSILIATVLFVSFCFNQLYGQGVMGQYPFLAPPVAHMPATSGGSAWTALQQPVDMRIPKTTGNERQLRAVNTQKHNYLKFSETKINLSDEARAANAGYEQHPDFGKLYPGAPCSDCYELIAERTETTKTFVREGIHEGGKEKMTQTSTQPMHYKDAKGNWVTIGTQLRPNAVNKGIYAISEEVTPVMINTNAGSSFASLGEDGNSIKFNHNLELIYVQANGTEVSLGAADYTHHTTGDEGMYVTNAWPGIDIEMNVLRAAIKTNFHINHAMPQYAAGKLLIRDHLSLDKGLTLAAKGSTEINGELMIKNNAGDIKYAIGAANVYEEGNYRNTVEPLSYLIGANNVLDIALPGNYLNKPELSYPIIIDPLVSTATSTTINGSSYITALTAAGGCVYNTLDNTPTNCTLTDIQFAFQYTAVAPNWLEYAGSWFYLGTCRSPGTLAGGNVWTCGPPTGAAPGTCTATGGTTYSIWGTPGATTSGLGPCVNPPQCLSYQLHIDFHFYQSYGPAGACAATYAYGSQPLVITVIGHTVEFVSATPSPATICLGASTTLTGAGTYGVPPYTFTWTPGPVVGSPATVTPGATTTYTLTITDACGINATGTTVVTVNSDAPITGTLSLCVGNTTTLGDATAGAHTWTSSTPGVATITSPGGVVNAIAAGTTTITYTSTATGCTTTAVVTVTPLPTAILGIKTVCAGLTTSLSDATGGGGWSSSNTAVATVDAAGIVTGIAGGTSTITYGGATCYVTCVVTVSPAPAAISGTLTVCLGNTTTLTDAFGAGTWTSSATGVATIGLNTGIVTGISAGTSVITFTTPTSAAGAGGGCIATAIVTVNTVSAISGTLSLCAGSTTTLTDATAGGTWSSSATGVATIGATTGFVTTIANGTTTITYTSTAGCTATAVVTVNALAPILGTLTVCQGSTTTLSNSAGAGTWSSSNTAVATAGAASGIITGVSPGTSTITFVTAAGCSATAVVTVNPATPITGTTSICAGTTTILNDATAGGTWSSTNTGVATITSPGGVVSAVAAGTTTISYLLPGGCYTTTTFTVITVAAITGTPVVCVGNTTALNDATAGGAWVSGTTAVATISAAGIVTGVSAGTSLITYTSGGGCTATITVTVNPLPSAITGIASVCVGLTTALSDVTPGGAWSSSNAAIATINASGIVSGVSGGGATVTYKLPTGCIATIPVTVNPLPSAISGPANVCAGSSIILSDAIAGGTWLSNNTAAAIVNVSTGLVTGVAAGVSAITYTLATGCIINTSVTVIPLPSAPVTGNLDYCQGSIADTLTAIGNNLLWYSVPTGGVGSSVAPVPTISVAGVYTVYVSQTVNGCEGPREPLLINVHTHPVFNIVPARPNACQYDTISFYCVSTPAFTGETFAWGLPSNGVLSAGSSATNSSILMYFDTTLGHNYVTLTVGDGYTLCNVTDSLPMTVYNNHPNATFYLKPNVCVGDSVTIALTSIGAGVTDFTWNFSGANMIASSSNHGGPFIVSWSTPGVYTVALTAISNLSCPSYPILDTVDVHAFPDPQIASPILLDSKTSTLCLGDSVLLSALNYVPEDMYVWAPAHFFEQRDVNRVYGTIQMPGYVYLTVTDPFGCTAKDSVLFNAQPCCLVYFPTAFTPNGDTRNDFFRPITTGNHTVHEFRIVNRWGQTVFESSNEKGQWDGNFNGVPQDIGVYYYYFKYDCDGKTLDEKGEVTLIR